MRQALASWRSKQPFCRPKGKRWCREVPFSLSMQGYGGPQRLSKGKVDTGVHKSSWLARHYSFQKIKVLHWVTLLGPLSVRGLLKESAINQPAPPEIRHVREAWLDVYSHWQGMHHLWCLRCDARTRSILLNPVRWPAAIWASQTRRSTREFPCWRPRQVTSAWDLRSGDP